MQVHAGDRADCRFARGPKPRLHRARARHTAELRQMSTKTRHLRGGMPRAELNHSSLLWDGRALVRSGHLRCAAEDLASRETARMPAARALLAAIDGDVRRPPASRPT